MSPHHPASPVPGTPDGPDDSWGPGDLIALIPHLLDEPPQDGDIAVVLFHPGSGPVALTLLRPTHDADPADLVISVEKFVAIAASRAGTGAVLIAYLATADASPLPHLLRALSVTVFDALEVRQGRWWHVGDAHPDRTAGPGTPVLPASAELLELVQALRAGSQRVDPEEMIACLQPGPDALRAQVEARLRARSRPSPVPRPRADGERAGRPDLTGERHLLALARGARDQGPRPLSAAEAAGLLGALEHQRLVLECMTWADESAWWLWRELIRHAPDGWIAPVAALIAASALHVEDGAQACVAARYALGEQTGYPPARIILQVLDLGVPAPVLTGLLEAALSHDERA